MMDYTFSFNVEVLLFFQQRAWRTVSSCSQHWITWCAIQLLTFTLSSIVALVTLYCAQSNWLQDSLIYTLVDSWMVLECVNTGFQVQWRFELQVRVLIHVLRNSTLGAAVVSKGFSGNGSSVMPA